MPAFTAPSGGAVNFALVSFTAPLGGAVDFDVNESSSSVAFRPYYITG